MVSDAETNRVSDQKPEKQAYFVQWRSLAPIRKAKNSHFLAIFGGKFFAKFANKLHFGLELVLNGALGLGSKSPKNTT